MDNSASFAGEVERNVSPDNDFSLRGQLLETLPLVIGQSAVSTQRKQGSATPRRYWHWATALRSGPDDVRPIAYCHASLKARRRGVTAVSVRRRFTASHFRFRVSATSGRLGMVRVLLQLKVNRLCLVVDGTAGFDP